VSGTGDAYDAANLAAQVRSLVTASSLPSPSAPASSAAISPVTPAAAGHTYSALDVATQPSLLSACVKEITAADGRTPIAVDAGRWQGEPALVIVLPAVDDPTSLEVFVVKPTCGSVQDSSDLISFTTVPRP
jgi:hypothetical protein